MADVDPKDARIAQLEAEVAELKVLLSKALGRIAELERQLGQNSSNSSKLPSSDGPGVQRPPKKPTGRKPGGQPGHKGTTRVLVGPERVNLTRHVKPTSCRKYHAALAGEDAQPRRHQVVEVPPLTAHVTEYRLHRLKCTGCGAETSAELPVGVPTGVCGPNLMALIAFLTGRMRLSKREAVEFLDDALGIPLSVGGLSEVEVRVAAALGAPYDEAEDYVRRQRAVHLDETGWRERRRRAWLWARVTRKVSVFRVARAQSKAEAKAQLGEGFLGTAVTDRFAGYAWVDVRRRQICWAHLARDFQALSEWEGVAGLIGAGLLTQAEALFDTWHRHQDGRIHAWTFDRYIRPVRTEVRRLLEAGAALPPSRPQRFCKGLLKLWPALWRFTRLDGVEPTNNAAERALRPAVLWRRGSFGTHSEEGNRVVERMLTVTASLRVQVRSVLTFLRDAMNAWLHGTPSPSLLPAGS
ncbi:MAG: IS66 family transposase [Myxococcaceae bacterium]|nr:IS66 family transposase [Myxococcaceae bacterium]